MHMDRPSCDERASNKSLVKLVFRPGLPKGARAFSCLGLRRAWWYAETTMTTLKIFEMFVLAAVIFAAIDLFWITGVVNKMYREELGSIVLKKPRTLPAVLFYVTYMAGLVYFAIIPGYQQGSGWVALSNGALYGFFTYCTFDLTNWSVLKDWTLKVVVADIAWGVFISGIVASLTRLIVGHM